MSKFNFNSQVCTSKVQSERLLALGLKKETADMVHSTIVVLDNLVDLISEHPWTTTQSVSDSWFPAWSLHRLLSLYNLHYIEFMNDEEIESVYDIVIDAIEQAIKEGYFNKEYLV